LQTCARRGVDAGQASGRPGPPRNARGLSPEAPAIRRLCRRVGLGLIIVGREGVAIIEVNDANERQPIPGPLDVRWVFRDGAPAGTTSLLDESLRDVVLPATDRHAFVFGESRIVRRLRDTLQARGVTPGELAAKGYWNVGRAMRD